MSELDVRAGPVHIPALASGVAFFDGPGGSQVPDVVANGIRDAMTSPIANRRTVPGPSYVAPRSGRPRHLLTA